MHARPGFFRLQATLTEHFVCRLCHFSGKNDITEHRSGGPLTKNLVEQKRCTHRVSVAQLPRAFGWDSTDTATVQQVSEIVRDALGSVMRHDAEASARHMHVEPCARASRPAAGVHRGASRVGPRAWLGWWCARPVHRVCTECAAPVHKVGDY